MEQSSRIRQRIEAGEVAIGSFHELAEPKLMALAARAGFDFVMLDFEHGLRDLECVGDAIRAARHYGMDALVRIGVPEIPILARFLDEGANGVVIAHVRNAAEMEAAVGQAYYPPLGDRGLDGAMARAMRRVGDPAGTAAEHNRRTLVFAIIEDEEGVANAREIAAVEGISGLVPGRGDLGFAALLRGAPSGTVERQVETVLEAGRATPGCILMDFARSDASAVARLRGLGVGAVLFGTDTALLEESYTRLIEGARAGASEDVK